MRSNALAAMLASMVCTGQAMAQQVQYWPAPTRGTESRFTYFPMGTPVALRTRTEVNTKQAKSGDRVYLEVVESLTYRGQVVVPVGALAVAEVARSERNGHFGKRGEIVVRLISVETPHGPARLTGVASHAGRSGTAASVATMAFVSPLGFLIHGTSGRLPYGTPVTAYLDEPLRFVSTPTSPNVAVVQGERAQPDASRTLPASFDPSAFSGSGVSAAKR